MKKEDVIFYGFLTIVAIGLTYAVVKIVKLRKREKDIKSVLNEK